MEKDGGKKSEQVSPPPPPQFHLLASLSKSLQFYIYFCTMNQFVQPVENATWQLWRAL